MGQVAKWSVITVVAMSLIIGVAQGLMREVPAEERQAATGATLLSVIIELWVLVACLIWWQP